MERTAQQAEPVTTRQSRRVAYRTYGEYLRHPKFRAIRAAVMKRANYRCERCLMNRATEVHHLQYPPWGTFDMPANIMAVCHGCHCDIEGKPE